MEETSISVIGEKSMVAMQTCPQLGSDFAGKMIKADIEGDIKVDITDPNSVHQFFANNQFEWAVVFSAYTDVNGAEKQKGDKTGICWQINVDGTRNIIAACKKYNRKLFTFSTDFVFDGTEGPYREDATPAKNLDKVSWYGVTKLESEKIILKNLDDFIILRISYPYSGNFVGKDDLVTKTLRLYKEGKLYPIYMDQVITPTYIPDISTAITTLIKRNYRGIYHLASPTSTTQHQFASRAVELIGGNPGTIQKGYLENELQKPQTTKRPLLGGLKVDKITKVGIKPTNWEEGLEKSVALFVD